ncbi:MAG: SDR family oxidoreductase [Rhodocyclaceae bacterium]|nr:SDR family oxidoreductase [Rhodocyclaceae bacterium]
MPAARNPVDPGGLLEYSVVYTDRAFNHMSQAFQGVMRDISRGVSYEQVLAERVATIPAGRIGNPEEFGAACAWLCSAQAGFITGQNWLLDGGAYPGTF